MNRAESSQNCSNAPSINGFFAFQEQDQPKHENIVSYIKETHKLPNDDVAKSVLTYALKLKNIRWHKGQAFSNKQLQDINNAVEEILFYCGPGALPAANDLATPLDPVESLVDFFVLKRKLNLFPLLRWKYVKHMLVEKDPLIMRQYKEGLQKTLNEGFTNFCENNISEDVFCCFVFNIVAFFAYTYPEEGSTFTIPIKIGDGWEQVTYHIDKKFALSPSWFSSPLPAFGLMPAADQNADAVPIISFLGTTFPGGEGFVASILSDCTLFASVGYLPSLYGRREIAEWLEDKQDVIVVGVSLGGSIALHSIRHHPSSISQVYAFDPAGHYPWNASGKSKDIDITIVYQWNDMIATTGFFPDQKNMHVFRFLSEEGENPIYAHFRIYPAGENVAVLSTTSAFENKRRERLVMTGIHIIASPFVFSTVLSMHLALRSLRSLHDFLLLSFLGKKRKHWLDTAAVLNVVALVLILIKLNKNPITISFNQQTHIMRLIRSKGFINLASMIAAYALKRAQSSSSHRYSRYF